MTEAPGDEPLGSLEAELLHILWDADDWLAAPALHERLTRGRPLAYTTVSTVLIRLWNKGHLERVRDGRSFAYRALQTKEQYTATRMAGLLAELADRPTALSWFLEFLDPAERAQLARMLTRDRSQP
jgi:predicted transcriptional regulator